MMTLYWDNAATTRPRSSLIDESRELDARRYANPSSIHEEGSRSRELIETARRQVKQAFDAERYRVVFTGSGSEANNLALRGSLERKLRSGEPVHVLTSPIEHKAVLNTLRDLKHRGLELEYLPTDGSGRVRAETLTDLLRPETHLVSVMWANNELGTLQPVDELVDRLKDHPARLHTDAVQAAGKEPISLSESGVDMLSLSAHKFHGFKGTGALLIRKNLNLAPVIHGGGQEEGLRSGTHDVRGIWGLGEALREMVDNREAFRERVTRMRDRLETDLVDRLPEVRILGEDGPRLPNISALAVPGARGSAIVRQASEHGLAISTGSACDSEEVDIPSHVVTSLDLDEIDPLNVIRVSFGDLNEPGELEEGVDILVDAIRETRVRSTAA